jgi:hypothetical protein
MRSAAYGSDTGPGEIAEPGNAVLVLVAEFGPSSTGGVRSDPGSLARTPASSPPLPPAPHLIFEGRSARRALHALARDFGTYLRGAAKERT